MEINIIEVGELCTNTYILSYKDKTIIIDPGADSNKIIQFLKDNHKDLVAILITHRHFDHIGALDDILKYKKVDVYDNNNLEEKAYHLSSFNFYVIKTPGHTSDSITFYFKQDNIMFVGDFIFKNSIGRTDLETGNYKTILNSIAKIKQYNDNIILYPGHGPSTILGVEKLTNPYFK